MTLQLTFLLDDVGIPKCYRTMPGFGVHAFKMLAKDGRETFVKFHWKPKQGAYTLRLCVHCYVCECMCAPSVKL